jgi:hypothetical protein
MIKLVRYWFNFDQSESVESILQKKGIFFGCGVTAFTEDDAIHLIKQRIFLNEDIPSIKKITPDVDIQTLESKHVRPNMGVVSERGIWFPKGYDF